MLNILLGILKIIGILLAVVFSLILVLILVILLGPICYRASGRYEEEKEGSLGISWLFFVLRAKGEYKEEKGFLWAVRLFGVLIASNEEEFLLRKEKKERKKAEKEQRKAEKEQRRIQKLQDKDDFKEPGRSEEKTEAAGQTEYSAGKETSVQTEDSDWKEATEQKKDSGDAQASQIEKTAEVQKLERHDKRTKKESKIKSVLRKIKAIPDKIKSLIAGIKARIESIKAKIRQGLEIKEFLFGDKNRKGFLHLLHHLKKMILHLLPRRLEGRVEFGVEDPYMMGQILTVLGIFYPLYQDKFTVLPDFENPGFSGEISLKGRIIPGYLVLRLLLALCNREVIRIIKEGKQLIGGNKA